MVNEKRLIDFENARKSVMEILAGKVNTPTAVKVYVAMQEAIVDAAEVVRCKDCKHWCTVDCAPNYGSCSKLEDRYKEDSESSFDETTRFDDFCSYGERKNDEDK